MARTMHRVAPAMIERSLADRGRAIRITERVLLFGLALAIAITIRAKLYGFASGDLTNGFIGWCDDIRKRGFAQALTAGDCNYNPAYVYVLWLANQVPFDRAHFLKTFSVLCDFVCAAAVAWAVAHTLRGRLRALLAAFALLVTPTVVFNSALWGQCDMVYAAPLVMGLAATIAGRQRMAAVLFGLAIAVKLQAIFLFPLLGVLVLRGEIRPRTLLLVPASYLATFVPAWLAGAPVLDTLWIYGKQAGQYSALTLSAPTVFALLADQGAWLAPFGLCFAAAVTLMLILACAHSKAHTTPRLLIQEAMVFASLIPFLLPHMHERYLFLADIISVLYAFVFPRRLWVPLCVVGASFTGYSSFLFKGAPVPLPVAATMMGVASVAVTVDLLKAHHPEAFLSQPELAAGDLARIDPANETGVGATFRKATNPARLVR